MKPEDMAKTAHESKEIRDMRVDLHDIETIFAYVNAGYGYDRNKAEEIIRKNNVSDPAVFARNSNPATTIPLARASDQTILDNLAFLHIKILIMTIRIVQQGHSGRRPIGVHAI